MKINQERLKERIDKINAMSKDSSGGYTRLAFSEVDRHGRELVQEMMREAGLTVSVDTAGNILGRLGASEGDAEGAHHGAIASGSHVDTVKNGGKFDGLLGSMAAIEAAQCIRESGVPHKRPLEVIIFADEEGARFNSGMIGSKSIAGIPMDAPLDSYVDRAGISLPEAMRACPGVDPDHLEAAKAQPGKYHAFVELHIEQSIVLEQANKQIGIVNGIKGPYWIRGSFVGESNHAGGTPMNRRKDALTAAANFAAEVERIASELGDMFVATIGVFQVYPGGINTIPGKVEYTIDIRDINMERRKLGISRIEQAAKKIAASFGVESHMACIKDAASVKMSPALMKTIEDVCLAGEYAYMILPSGPFHDTLPMAAICDVGMIFVPSIGGISHSPYEDTAWPDIYAGAQVLLDTLERLIMQG